mmetsp:Transcript_58894/g.97433  ORF Transcript_58894/g.97433 Transcript_58894/m.97433 type:complete len:548 (-) Transcript_58894:308-1951(-)|eukprot:CAMPEP_0202686650 /NCGR_PEP_ID=MMETSP1385-20130828/2404_1 /ASSEMBLY_ACC=CAM_ASM_000861 /TAXON_ID=933848 /ORGANISM="Elphidium margaritaceum" /LENGTH=547 /DNA_ID=CAMNT_0049341271 /DNA_START=24 /DNA_END=1667 /DNA_ORIENTATION=+
MSTFTNDLKHVKEDMWKHSTSSLKKKCKAKKIAHEGTKSDLIERLAQTMDVKIVGMNKRQSSLRYQHLLSQLTFLGWNQAQALDALKAAKGNLPIATELLMTGGIDCNMEPVVEDADRSQDEYVRYNTPIHVDMEEAAEKQPTETGFVRYNALLSFAEEQDQEVASNEDVEDVDHDAKSTSDDDNLSLYSANNLAALTQSPQSPQSPLSVNSSDISQCSTPMSSEESNGAEPNSKQVDDAMQKLMSGHASIKQRIVAMETLNQHLNDLDMSTDHGKALFKVYADQVLHEDHIYGEYAVRIKAMEQLPGVLMFCLNSMSAQQIASMIENGFSSTLDALFKLLDNNRHLKFHTKAEACITTIVDAVIFKKDKAAIVNLCGLLNSKVDSEHMNQPKTRFLAAKLLFKHVIFQHHTSVVNKLFDIDIESFLGDDGVGQWSDGMDVFTNLPQNRAWIDIMTAEKLYDDLDETFKDIIVDCLNLMLFDPNSDIEKIAANMIICFSQINDNFRHSLGPEAKYKFRKRYISQHIKIAHQSPHCYAPSCDKSLIYG